MRLITRQKEANGAAERWRRQYGLGQYGDDKLEILAKLEALGENPAADEVDATIGNGSWTATVCDECGVKNVDVVEVGQEPDYESRTAHICKGCLSKALDL